MSREITSSSAYVVLSATPSATTGGVWYVRNAAGTNVHSAGVLTVTTTGEIAPTTDATIGGSSTSPATVADDFSVDFDHTTGTDPVDKTYFVVVYD